MRPTLSGLLFALTLMFLTGCQSPTVTQQAIERYRLNDFSRELTEMELLGITLRESIDEGKITQALNEEHIPIRLHKGDRLLVVQSGADMPDEQMTALLETTFTTQPFTGITEYKRTTPEPDYMLIARLFIAAAKEAAKKDTANTNEQATPAPDFAQVLRFAAVRSDIKTIMVYWSILESGIVNHQTKLVSWLPIVGTIIPDETRYLRIRTKVCLIDTQTGHWQAFTPKTFNNKQLTTFIDRHTAHEKQVENLKAMAYQNTVMQMWERYGISQE